MTNFTSFLLLKVTCLYVITLLFILAHFSCLQALHRAQFICLQSF